MNAIRKIADQINLPLPLLSDYNVDLLFIPDEDEMVVLDSNGNKLEDGDSVIVIKDLPVKGAGFTAKQGTTVKNIRMVPEDPTHIQGRVNGTMIFLKTEFLKKL